MPLVPGFLLSRVNCSTTCVVFTGSEGARRGSMYAVYEFLELVLGVRFFAPDETRLPRVTTLPSFEPVLQPQPKVRYRSNGDWTAFGNRNYSRRLRYAPGTYNECYGPDYGLEGCGPEDFDRFFFASPPGEESSYNLLCDNASEIGSAAKAGCGDAEKPPPKVFVSARWLAQC